MNDEDFLRVAIALSKESAERGIFPVGAIIVENGEIASTGTSDGKHNNDPTWHAETDAIRKLCHERKTRKLKGATLYSSMEPCLMCYGAIYWAGIDRVVFPAGKDKLDKMHYEGLANSVEVNEIVRRNRPLELIHDIDLEQDALNIILDWEEKYARA